jgi:glycosyltransferase involved in cell wall biosynthesis
MRILMFNYEYPPLGGGGGVVHQHIAEELARRHDVTVVTSGHPELAPRETVGGVDVHRVKVFGRRSIPTASLPSMLAYYPASLRKGQALIAERRPDLLNSHFAIPTGPSVVRLAKRAGLPHALCIHGGDIFDPSKGLSPHRVPILKRTVRWVLNESDRVLAQSQNTADNARRIYGYSREIAIIPHGLKVPNLPNVRREALGLASDAIVLVTVGRLVARKANEQLVEVLAALNDPRVILVILGEGPEREKIEAAAAARGVADRVRLPGHVEDAVKFQYLTNADCFVSTTQHEGFGLMYVEAMFCSLPIVTYDHGGQTDFLEGERSGALVPLNDRARFASALRALIEDPVARQNAGRHNLMLSERFTIQACAARYETIFRSMITNEAARVA